MAVEWFSQQLASIENVRMKYSGSDFKFTSQANHMAKILQLKKDYEREGFHMQRLYKRRIPDRRGVMRSTLGIIMQPVNSSFAYETVNDAYRHRNVIDYQDLVNKPSIENTTLIGDKTFEQLNLLPVTDNEIDDITSS